MDARAASSARHAERASSATTSHSLSRLLTPASAGVRGARISGQRGADASSSSSRRKTGTSGGTAHSSGALAGSAIVAIIEQPRSLEIGVAAYSLDSFSVEMRQFTDDHAYTRLISALTALDPVEIVRPSTAADDPLTRTLTGHGSALRERRFTFLARRLFSDTSGADAIERLAADTIPVRLVLETPKYLALAACSAVLKYMEHKENTIFAPRTVRFTFRNCADAVFMDTGTVESLELLVTDAPSMMGECASLYRKLKHTRTRVGARLLRRAIIEPPALPGVIEDRLDAVAELLGNETMYFALGEVLRRMPDVESVLSQLYRAEARAASAAHAQLDDGGGGGGRATGDAAEDASTPAAASPPNMDTIKNMLLLREALELLPPLIEAISDGRGREGDGGGAPSSALLRECVESFRTPVLAALRDAIHRIVSDDVAHTKGTEQMRLQSAFAVRAGVNGLLDIARRTLSGAIEDIYSQCESLKRQLRQPKLQVSYNTQRGYHLSVPTIDAAANPLPGPEQDGGVEPLRAARSGASIRFTTAEIARLNGVYHEALDEIWSISDAELAQLRRAICALDAVRALHHFSDRIAELDLLASHASAIIGGGGGGEWVRPRLTADGGPIAIKAGRHPLLEDAMRDANNGAPGARRRAFVPNDMYLDEARNIALIFGVNASGKSVYIKQAALIAVLAHIGCYVPAQFASVRVLAVLLVRSRTRDSMEHNVSSFALEMREIATIMQFTQDREEAHDAGAAALVREISGQRPHRQSSASHPGRRGRRADDRNENGGKLVLIDELGRSTTALDGQAIAWAVLEHLAGTTAYVLFASHFSSLGAIADELPNVRVMHMRSSVGATIRHEFKIGDGHVDTAQYGIELARFAGLPAGVVDAASAIRSALAPGAADASTTAHHRRSLVCVHRDDQRICQQYHHANALYQRLLVFKYSGVPRQEMARRIAQMLRPPQRRASEERADARSPPS